MGDTYDVFGLSTLPEDIGAYTDARDADVTTLFLLPSLLCDCEAVCFDYRAKRCDFPSAAVAAAIFLVRVRGLPLDECEVLCGGEIYTVTFDENGGKCEILLKKCKEMYEISPGLYRNVEVKRWKAIDGQGEVLMLPTADATEINSDSLRLACLPESGAIRMVVALSIDGGEICVRDLPVGEAPGQACRAVVTAATYAMRFRGVSGAVHLLASDCRDGAAVSFYARSRPGGISICADGPPPAVLYAPDGNFDFL